jgi:hypothetical protein
LLKLPLEDIVLTTAVVLGLVGGAILSTLNVPPITSAIFFGVGIAALVYRFLGGISQKTSITIIGIKLTGSAAALIGIALIVNSYLVIQVECLPRKNLTISFSREARPIKERCIKVSTKKQSIDMSENGEFIIPLKDFAHNDGRIFIDWQPEVEKLPTKTVEKIDVQYTDKPPRITLGLDFLYRKDLFERNITISLRRGGRILKDRGLIIKNDREKEKTMNEDGEFILPPDFFKGTDGYIYIERKQKEEERQKQEPIRISLLQYKINPPEIIIHLDKSY